MKRTIVLTVALIVICSYLLANCRRGAFSPEEMTEWRNRILREHAAFDKTYIAALLLTGQGKVEQSQKAMALLRGEWEIFANKRYPEIRNSLKYRRTLDRVQKAVRTADHIVSSGGNLRDAHEALEGIRFILMDFRRSRLRTYRMETRTPGGEAGFIVIPGDYYVDYVTEFYEPMEAIVLTARHKTPETLTGADVEKIEEQLAEALKLLTTMENAEFEPSIFDFSDEKTQTMGGYISHEAESLDKLKDALEVRDKGEIIRTSMGIEPGFMKLLALFGDFESLE